MGTSLVSNLVSASIVRLPSLRLATSEHNNSNNNKGSLAPCCCYRPSLALLNTVYYTVSISYNECFLQYANAHE